MEYEFLIFISLIYLFLFYLIIKAAVSKGIDDSKSINEMKNEIKELKRYLKSEVLIKEKTNNIINRKT